MTDLKNNNLRIRLLRHSAVSSGGFYYEKSLTEKLCSLLGQQGFSCLYEVLKTYKIREEWRNLKLIWWGWKNSTADINIVTARLALSSVLKDGITLIVLHNYDENDGKGKYLKLYYRLLFKLLRWVSGKKVAIICVAPFFKDLFVKMLPNLSVFMVPNLFNNSIYTPYKKCLKQPESIFLGQYSKKNDDEIFALAEMLTFAGYNCFFATLIPAEVVKTKTYEVISVSYEEYLKKMAEAYCTIAFTKVNEGWNRLCHESILVGTPVIGFKRGGLGDLLKEAHAYIVKSAQDAFRLITSGEKLIVRAPESFYFKYSTEKAGEYLNPVIQFIKQSLHGR